MQHPFRGGVSHFHPVRSTAKKLNPATALREHEKATPHRAGIATLHGPDRRRNRDRKARLIGPGSRRGSAGQNTGQWRSLTLRFQGQHTHLIQPPGDLVLLRAFPVAAVWPTFSRVLRGSGARSTSPVAGTTSFPQRRDSWLRAGSHVCQPRANMGHPKIENEFSS